ncbi:hypothetical protein BJ170DRAFT_222768 [Xylariales sp. AK1849]|nr:hypothetical protein BJ170DRAFT_222768 [Xylariales sp. AK1849]
MREGVDEDDMYRMVEDEFTSTAQRFTAHLHAVEYQKLKDAAKTQNAQTIKSISRPVVGSMSDLVQKKQARAARLKKQRTATNGNMSDDDTDDDAYHQGTSLFGLMASPRKKVPRLPVDHTIPLPGSKRAAVGFQRGTHTSGRPMQASSGPTSGSSIKMATHHAINLDRHDEDDDLDAPSRRPPAISSTSSAGATAPRPMKSLGKTAQPNIPQKRRHGPPPKSQSRPQPHSAAQGTHEDQGQSSNDDSNGALFGFQKRTQQLNNRSRRKDGVTAKSKGADHQKSEQDFIPGFL